MTQLWYSKYRPKTLDDFVWSTVEVKEKIEEWMKNKFIPHLFLAGPPGVGKTTLVNIIISTLGIEPDDVLYLKGVDDNSVDTVRTTITDFCTVGGWGGLKIIFFDEADSLTMAAQQSLRTVMDDYSDTVRFIFTCNFPHKVIEPLSSSRMFRIDIKALDKDSFFEKIVEVLVDENIELINPDALYTIRDTCYPDLRKAINTLQNSVKDGKLINASYVMASTPDWEEYITSILTNQINVLDEVIKIKDFISQISVDEIEKVYRFLYQNLDKLFFNRIKDLQERIKIIYIINNGQKVHRNCLLPDMILLEVLVRLVGMNEKS